MSRIFGRLVSTVSITLLLSLAGSKVLSDQIIIRADKQSFPATYMRDGQWLGMDIEFLEALLSRANLAYSFTEIPFPRSLLQIEQGTIQVIPNLVKNAARSEYMHWLGPNRVTCIGLVVQQDDRNLDIQSTDDLIRVANEQGKRVGYLTGASYSPYLDERLKNDALLRKVLYFLPDNAQHREMLRLGRILGYFYDAFEIQQRLKEPGFSTIYDGLALHNYRIEDSCTGAYIGISKKIDQAVYQSMQAAFESMKDDGTFAALHKKWLGTAPDF